MSRTREYYKMKDYNKMKAMTEEYCAKGIGAVETSQIMLEKFGDSTPTICTIYKWRRDFLDRKRGHDDEEGGGGKINVLEDVQKLAKIPRKVSLEKYCADCNRDLCTRQYYELHMLKLHDVLVGDSKPVIEYLDELAPSRTQHIIFRCDACFGGALDYDTIEEWEQHKLLEHGQQMRMPKWCSTTIAAAKSSNVKSPPPPAKMSLQQNVKSSMSPPAPAAAAIPPKYTKVMIIRRDQSLPASSFLRRSNRVPKPISRLNYLLLAKDDNEEMERTNESGGEEEERKNTPKEFSKKVRHVNFMEGTKEISSSTNGGSSKLEGNIKEKPAAVHAKQQQREEVNINGEVNGGIGGFSKEEKVEIVIKEKAVEKVQIRIQKPPQEENPPQVNNKTDEFTPPPKRVRLLSTDTLDAATTLLKLTFGSTPLNLTDDDILEEQNSPTIVNECSNVGVETIKTTTTKTTSGTTSTSILSNLPHSPPPTVSMSTSNNSVSIQSQSTPAAKLMPIESTNLKSPPAPASTLHLPLPKPSTNISSGLSNTAELAAELDKAEERKAAETRIQALKNIQWLFDQAMLQFQQYLAAMPKSTIHTTINGNGQINGIQDECAISNLLPSSSSMNLGTSSSTTSSSTQMPTVIQNGIISNSSSSMATTKTNNK